MVVIKSIPSYFSAQQLDAYLHRVGLDSISRKPSIETLNLLVRHHLRSFPYENTEIHYKPVRQVDISPSGLFERFVVQQTGGGHCIAQNTIMLEILRAMGFRAYATVARPYLPVPDSEEYAAVDLAHMLLFVQLPSTSPSSDTYLVDVGLPSLSRPILLRENEEIACAALPEKVRLVKRAHEPSSLEWGDGTGYGDEWRLQSNFTFHFGPLPEGEWRDVMTFGTREFFHIDMEAIWYAASDRMIFIKENVMSVIFTPLEDKNDPYAMGRLVLGGDKLVCKARGEVELLKEMRSEQDRIEALREYFNIAIADGADRYLVSAARLWHTAQRDNEALQATLPVPAFRAKL